MRTSDFEYDLPPELIAQTPLSERDQSRLLVLHRGPKQLDHRRFPDLVEYLRAGDVLVLNDSRVIPARLRGINARSGGQFEVLLIEETGLNDWWVMLRPGKRARIGTEILFRDSCGEETEIRGVVVETNAEGHRRLRFTGAMDIKLTLEKMGEVPLPPYIRRSGTSQAQLDRERYQTVFARVGGSVAAPTAGLHFTRALLERIRQRGATVCYVTLHVGLGTFAPVKAEDLSAHVMHEEKFDVSEETAAMINHAKREKRRIIAVGTTTLRVLESGAAGPDGHLWPAEGSTRIFVHPPHQFKLVDGLLTNFHLPCSTLLMLVSAFAAPGTTQGREVILSAYSEAIRGQYRFFSYGDAMLIL